MAKIKILSGWSNPGGSTEAFINLCNLFNQRGHDCTFYGPHEFHLDKCKSGMLGDCPVNEFDERLIVHYLKLPQRPEESEAVILACHEKEIFPVKDIPCFWDNTVFVSESQREWHGTNGVIIPNVVADLEEPKAFILGQPAGIIGSIDENKQTHVSIQRALDDGNKLVKLFGVVTDHGYYDEYVKPYVEDGKAELMGHEDDKQKMYNSLSCVYHSSKSETFNLVKVECAKTGTPYHGLPSAESGAEDWTNSKILSEWEKCLNIS